MNIFASKGNQTAAFKLNPVAAGCAVFLSVLGSTAYAQTAPASTTAAAEPAVQSVVVSGIRRGIEDAISVKKDSSSIVEAISAEDIGKLPDVSIAESISRLPGLAAQRVAGRAQVISVRGLSPDFATTLLNGREQVSTGDNRSVEFDQYPSELLAGVTIYKTPDAGLVGQGLSGTIDLQTVRPLSFGNRTVAMNIRGERNSLGNIANEKATGNRVSFSYIDQYMNRTLGVAIGFAHLDSPILDQQTGLYEPWKTDGRNGVPSGTYITDGAKALARSGRNKRDGVMAVVQYRPSKMWNSVLDVYASRFKREDTANQFEVNLSGYNGGVSPAPVYNPAITSGGVLVGGTIDNVYPLVRGMYTKRKDDIKAAGWSNNFSFGSWSLLADVNYSKAERDELSLENNLQLSTPSDAPVLDSVRLGFGNGNFSQMNPTLDYNQPGSLYVRNSIYGSGYGKVPRVEDELKGFKLVASLPAPAMAENFLAGFDIGFNVTDRTKKKRQPEGNINLAGPARTIESDLLYGSVDLGFAGTGMIPSWNVPGVVSRYMSFQPSDTASYLVSKAWDVNEKITTAFVKANIDHDMGDITLRGNFGVQVQRTDQSSTANYYDGTAPAGQQVKPVVDGKEYTDYLPSLNLVFGLPDQQTIRFGAAKQIARPRVDQLRAALEFGVSTTTFEPGGSGGNAQLDPWRAKALDISYEKYFGKKAYWAVAMFYKKLDTYIFTQTKDYDFSKFTPGTIANTNIGNYTAPYNGDGGTLRGLELSASLPLNMISPTLDGFGISASGTFSDSAITIEDGGSNIGTDIPLPGLSKRVANLTVYYEKNGFETRVSQRRRSDFVGEIGNFSNDRTLRYVVGESVLDFQIGYSFQEGSMKGLGLVLQVNNVTNEGYETYAGSRNKQLEYGKYGRTIMAGANYKF
jgi:iron complex outermembrane recepter protein